MLLSFDPYAEEATLFSECAHVGEEKALGSFCAVTHIVELIEPRRFIFAYDNDGSERWYLFVGFVGDVQNSENFPIAEPKVLINRIEPELYVKVWRSTRVCSLRCFYGRGELEWEFREPVTGSQFEIVSVASRNLMQQVVVYPSGARIYQIGESAAEIDAVELLDRSVKTLDFVSERFVKAAARQVQSKWDSTPAGFPRQLSEVHFLGDAELCLSGECGDSFSLSLLHSYGVYGRKISDAWSTLETLSSGKIREVILPHPRTGIGEYSQVLGKVAGRLSLEGAVVGATISAGSVPMVLSAADETLSFSGMLFDRCIAANGKAYQSDLDNEQIYGSLCLAERKMLGEGFARIERCLPVLSIGAQCDSRIAKVDRLQFRPNRRDDLIQLELVGGHVSIPWDVERLRYLLQLLFLETYVA